MSHSLCTYIQCPLCMNIPVQLREALVTQIAAKDAEIAQLIADKNKFDEEARRYSELRAESEALLDRAVEALLKIARASDYSEPHRIKEFGDCARETLAAIAEGRVRK